MTRDEFEVYRIEQDEKQKTFQDCVKCRMKCIADRVYDAERQVFLFSGLSVIAIVESVAAIVISIVA